MPVLEEIRKNLARIGLLLAQADGKQERRVIHWRRELELLETLSAALSRLPPDQREDGWVALLEQQTSALGRSVVGAPSAPPAREGKRPKLDPRVGKALAFYPGFLEQERQAYPEPPPPLPVFEARAELVEKIRRHDVLLLTGETGSGKSLLAPLFALEAGLGRRGRIVQTQPRRVAARQIAWRLAQMTGSEPGALFGCHTRLDRSFGKETLVKVATDGILLQELRGDPLLSRYELVILDEAHERSLNIDLLLGLIKGIRERRPQLKLIVTSATLEQERFVDYWQLSPEQVLSVPGRLFPVELLHREPDPEGEDEPDALAVRIAREVAEICARDEPGDVLVFLPRYEEIVAAARVLRGRGLPPLELLAMHGRQDPAENARCFQPAARRKVVLATNIAETSITLPGIRTVIDSGAVNQKRFDPKTGITSLRPRPISQASADQRAGRAGRLSEGRCIRLWPFPEHALRPAFTEPEIRRSDLAGLVLRMADLDIAEIPRFPFLSSPSSQQLGEARRTLIELGALERGGPITALGRQMAALPLDPRVAAMVLAARRHGCQEEVLTIAAVLSISRSLFRQPPADHPGAEAARGKIDQIKRKLAGGGSDFDALRALVDGYRALRWRDRKRYCEEHQASLVALEEVSTIRADLARAAGAGGKPKKPKKGAGPVRPDAIARAVLAGLVGNVAVRTGRFSYAGPGEQEVYIHPGSVLFGGESAPKLIVAGAIEQGEQRTYARHCMALQLSWLQETAPHLMAYTHRNKRYDEASGRVLAEEDVFFRQLTVAEGQEIDLFARDPDEALRLLIEEGLLADRLGLGLEFHQRNEAVLEEARRLADRLGAPDLAADEQTLLAFYIGKLRGCRSKQDVTRRVKDKPERLLAIELSDLLGPEEQQRAAKLFPTEVALGSCRCSVEYVYNPWNGRRTATIRVPASALDQLKPGVLEQAIPGLVGEQELPRVEVADERGRVLCNEVGYAAVKSALEAVDRERAWEEARAALETEPTDQLGRVPELFDGLCQPVEVCGDVVAVLGLERDARGWRRRLFKDPQAALARSRDALVGLVRLKIALRPQVKQGLAPKIPDKLSARFFEITGQPSLADALARSLEWMGCGGCLSAEEFQAGLSLERIGRETEAALALAALLPGAIERALAALARLRKDPAAAERVGAAIETLRTLQQRHPREVLELCSQLDGR